MLVVRLHWGMLSTRLPAKRVRMRLWRTWLCGISLLRNCVGKPISSTASVAASTYPAAAAINATAASIAAAAITVAASLATAI